MRILIYILSSTLVIVVAYWAYTENYTTQASNRRVDALQRQIATESQAISVMKAEWAYLNRPERLAELVDLNFNSLQLVPLAAQHFAELETIPLPPRAIVIPNNPVSVASDGAEGTQYP
tara:strand:- start:1973 stop:2329 length:357 start_codon:yes stop_codon:yes gene_type:complete